MSVFTDASFALSLVAANFGIGIAARMPMITTTISSSMRVKPLRFVIPSSGKVVALSSRTRWCWDDSRGQVNGNDGATTEAIHNRRPVNGLADGASERI